jgi:hypothetical protein
MPRRKQKDLEKALFFYSLPRGPTKTSQESNSLWTFQTFQDFGGKFGVRGPASKSGRCPEMEERDRSRFAQSTIY